MGERQSISPNAAPLVPAVGPGREDGGARGGNSSATHEKCDRPPDRFTRIRRPLIIARPPRCRRGNRDPRERGGQTADNPLAFDPLARRSGGSRGGRGPGRRRQTRNRASRVFSPRMRNDRAAFRGRSNDLWQPPSTRTRLLTAAGARQVAVVRRGGGAEKGRRGEGNNRRGGGTNASRYTHSGVQPLGVPSCHRTRPPSPRVSLRGVALSVTWAARGDRVAAASGKPSRARRPGYRARHDASQPLSRSFRAKMARSSTRTARRNRKATAPDARCWQRGRTCGAESRRPFADLVTRAAPLSPPILGRESDLRRWRGGRERAPRGASKQRDGEFGALYARSADNCPLARVTARQGRARAPWQGFWEERGKSPKRHQIRGVAMKRDPGGAKGRGGAKETGRRGQACDRWSRRSRRKIKASKNEEKEQGPRETKNGRASGERSHQRKRTRALPRESNGEERVGSRFFFLLCFAKNSVAFVLPVLLLCHLPLRVSFFSFFSPICSFRACFGRLLR